jgi:signal transduction histidine kinase
MTFERWHRLMARLGGRTPARRDFIVATGILAVLLGVRVVFAVILVARGEDLPVLRVVVANSLVVLDCLVVALRRRAPVVAYALALAGVLVGASVPFVYSTTGFGLLVSLYTIGTILPQSRVLVAFATGMVVHAVGGILIASAGGHVDHILTFWANNGASKFNLVIASAATFSITTLIGLYVRSRREYVAGLAASVTRLEAEQVRQRQDAARQERDRIARDLHDVAAHDLSAIVVQAGAADRLVDRDPAAAKATLHAIRDQGRRTLAAMRGLVGIMREDTIEPQPTLAQVDDLVEGARRVGMDIRLTRVGAGHAGAETELAGYRLVQEAITNARRHAPGAAVTVTVTYADTGIELEVRNTTPTSEPVHQDGGGHGLPGMRDRVRHAGGTLSAGPTVEGGWLVRARFPEDM